jgi:hypothetical protein
MIHQEAKAASATERNSDNSFRPEAIAGRAAGRRTRAVRNDETTARNKLVLNLGIRSGTRRKINQVYTDKIAKFYRISG